MSTEYYRRALLYFVFIAAAYYSNAQSDSGKSRIIDSGIVSETIVQLKNGFVSHSVNHFATHNILQANNSPLTFNRQDNTNGKSLNTAVLIIAGDVLMSVLDHKKGIPYFFPYQ